MLRRPADTYASYASLARGERAESNPDGFARVMLSIVVLYTLYRVYPFSLGAVDSVARIALLVATFAVGVAIIVEAVGLVRESLA